MKPILEVKNLTKSFRGKTVVNNVSLDISPGECLGILGPNGAGKTTTIRMILGLTHQESGSIQFLDEYSIPARSREARAKIGVVNQFDTLDPDFNVTENLRVYSRYYGIGRKEIEEKIPGLLKFASLESKSKAKISELSGGMKRRLSLIRALVNDPKLLVLDEPTTGLDPQARQLIWQRLKELMRQGIAILLTTHFMDEAEKLCDRLMVIDEGKKLVEGPPDDLIQQGLEREVLEIYGDDPDKLTSLEEFQRLVSRYEVSGDTIYAYVNEVIDIEQSLGASLEGYRYIQRRTNLEDLFIKLTGRNLRD